MVAYRHPDDALKSIPVANLFGLYPCTVRRDYDGIAVLENIRTDQCFKMLPQKQYRGIWLDQFESSMFFEGELSVAVVEAKIRRDPRMRKLRREWLSWNEQQFKTQSSAPPQNRYFLIDFIGRRTAYPGQYGHLGMSRSEIIVDRMLSLRPVGEAATP